jgi:pimeloyl-ACP methyl ester carboxylesterase
MKTLLQEDYLEPAEPQALSEEPLVVHCRPAATTNDKLVIFVHGLGGRRYGDSTTWGDFPRFIFDDMRDTDVGMYQYRTLLGRLRLSKSVSLEQEAKVFADVIRDQLKQYQNIVLIGHSMGGLLCKALIQRLVEVGGRNALSRIGGLILMATPQLGSLRVPGFLSGLTSDGRALKAHGDLVTKINTTFEDHIALDEQVFTLRKYTIPTWAVEGISDLWVDPLSSGIGLASSRRKVVRGSHTSIVKPADKNAAAYDWVKERLSIAATRFKYDVFIAAAMAGHEGDADYKASRDEVLQLINTLKSKCGCRSVFYAGEPIDSKDKFDPNALALNIDLKAMRESRYFILYYPQKLPSSVLYEAGWALILGKPSLYIVRQRKELPFLLNDASQAFQERRVRVFECKDTASMLNEVASYGEQLFSYREDDGH